jgi:predicted nucleic acid-binding protein
MARTVYWDANVFHALFGNEAGRVDICMQVEKAAREGKVEIYTSTATFVECVWIKGHPNKLAPEHEELIQKYFMHKFIKPINCDRPIAESARNLIWKFPHLQPKDAIHVASAISQQVDILHTFDKDLLKLSGKVGNPPLKICQPEDDENSKPKPKADELNLEAGLPPRAPSRRFKL